MMGTKIRSFSPLLRNVSLEELVPKDNFYRRLEERLDLSFIRDLVGPLYASGGRPSVDDVLRVGQDLWQRILRTLGEVSLPGPATKKPN